MAAVSLPYLRAGALRFVQRPQRRMLLVMGGLVAWAAGSAAWSVQPGHSLANAAAFATLVVIGAGASVSRWRNGDVLLRDTVTIWGVLALVAVASLAAGLFGVFDPFAPPNDRLRGVLGNPNTLAMVCLLVLPMTAGLWRIAAIRTSTTALVGAASAATLWWTESRTGFAAMVVGVAVASMQGRTSRSPSGRGLFRPATLVVLAVCVVLVAWGPLPDASIVDRVDDTETVGGRTEAWGEAIDLWRERPISGHGHRTGEYLFRQQRSAGQLQFTPDTVHNGYLQVLLELGGVGFALIIGLTVISLWPGGGAVRPPLLGAVAAGWTGQIAESSVVGLGALFAPAFWLMLFMVVAAARPGVIPETQLRRFRLTFAARDQ